MKYILYLYIELTETSGNVLLYGRFHCNSLVMCAVRRVVTCPKNGNVSQNDSIPKKLSYSISLPDIASSLKQ